MRVAVVQNRDHSGVINRFGQQCPEKYGEKTVAGVLEALRQQNHDPVLCEGDMRLGSVLETLLPPDSRGRPSGMVFNMAYGIQGECRYTHVPGLLEMAGVPYTGSSPLGHALSLDKVVTKDLIRAAGVPTPNFRVMRGPGDSIEGLRFPVVVKPRHESTSFGLRLAHDRTQAADAVEAIVTMYQQDALVEEYIEGREVCIGLLGNSPPEVLPVVEQNFGDRETRLVTWEDKSSKVEVPTTKTCPAPLTRPLASALREIALATFAACHCRDYARVDIRIDRDGNPFVLEINSMASLGSTGSYVLAASAGGYDFPALIGRILDVAHERYFGVPAPRSHDGQGCAEIARLEFEASPGPGLRRSASS